MDSQRRASSTAKALDHASGEGLMAKGAEVLFEQLDAKIEASLGRPMPQLEVRFANVTLSAELTVVEEDPSKSELPTLPNAVKKAFAGPKKRVVRKEILRDVSGVFRPGTITLVLGQPGSGKSALMKLLSARFPMRKNIKLEGDITFNGVKWEDTVKVLPQFAAYVAQRDCHFASLTVKETLAFANECCQGELSRRGDELLSKGSPEENAEAKKLAKALFDHYPDVAIQELGLQICQDTVVGDTMLRGISGGERKRVTIGEMEFGLKYAAFLDEISTGLDSAAAYDIVEAQRSVAHCLKKTVVIALLQPPPEVFSLFDDVLLMNEGQIMYHGPCDQVMGYFEKLGFRCPPGRAVADFLLDLASEEQMQYVREPAVSVPRTASEFASLFRESNEFHATLAALDAPLAPHLKETAEINMKAMPEFSEGFWASTWTVFSRQFMVTYRQHAFILGRVLNVLINCFFFCTIFADFDPTQVSVVLGVVFAGVMIMSMGQAAQIPTYMKQRAVFYKQRGANFFRTASYVLATSVCYIPLAIGEVLLFGSLIYWVCGFEADAVRFIIFEIVLFLSNLAMGMWFFFLASVSPNSNIATPMGMAFVMVFVVFAGFIVTKGQIPDYLIWAHWISPVTWALKALSINQYRAATFDVCEYGGIDYCSLYNMTMGEYYLNLLDIDTGKEWVAYGIIYLVGIYFVFMLMSIFVLEFMRYETPENVDVSKEIAAITSSSYELVQTPKNAVASPKDQHDQVVEIQDRERNFTPITIAFEDLWYSVPDPNNPKESLELLRSISGFATPGTMTALMGSTGAGKTTLMDVIAGRKTGGKITGRLLLNGYPATPLAIQRCTGYCEQADIHCDATTIREALTFSAFLRQDSQIPDSVKFDSVNEAIELLGFEDIADQIVRGSSVEQMKRLTIGVELAAQPSILFLDEPTSGLDARSAKLIMDGVRKVADSGRTIVCTIHQPSAEVFYLFDSLLLLKRGGQTVFFGELGFGCRNLIEYFEAVPGTLPLPEGYNPATWMLECIGAGVNTAIAHDVDFVERFNSSPFRADLDEVLTRDGVGQPSTELPEVVFTKKRAADSWTQMRFVVRRYLDMYWRTPTYNLTRFIISIVLALLLGLIFVDADYDSYQGLNSGVGMVFVATLFMAMVAYQSVLPLTCEERESFYRERASQTYNAFWYFLASTVAETPYIFASSLVFTVIFYPMVGFTGFTAGVVFWLGQSLLVMLQTFMGMFFCYALPTEEVAAVIGVLVNIIFILFMGFLPPKYAIPDAYTWLYDISPHRYALSTMVALVFADCDDLPTWNAALGAYEGGGSQLGCQPMRNAPVTVGHITLKEYTEEYFNMKHDDIPTNFAIVIGYIVLFRLLGLLALRYINHQKK